jgi:hypothetical protein
MYLEPLVRLSLRVHLLDSNGIPVCKQPLMLDRYHVVETPRKESRFCPACGLTVVKKSDRPILTLKRKANV